MPLSKPALAFKQIVSVEKNSFNDTYLARILFDVDGVDECRFFKFQGQPPNKEIMNVVNNYITKENTPKSVEVLEQELLQIQQEFDEKIEELMKKEEELVEAKLK